MKQKQLGCHHGWQSTARITKRLIFCFFEINKGPRWFACFFEHGGSSITAWVLDDLKISRLRQEMLRSQPLGIDVSNKAEWLCGAESLLLHPRLSRPSFQRAGLRAGTCTRPGPPRDLCQTVRVARTPVPCSRPGSSASYRQELPDWPRRRTHTFFNADPIVELEA